MRALLLIAGLLLALPLAAAGALFVTLPAPSEPAIPCGAAACFPLLAGESSVSIAGGSAYAFLSADGATLSAGALCAPRLLDVPPGAAMLRVDPAGCES